MISENKFCYEKYISCMSHVLDLYSLCNTVMVEGKYILIYQPKGTIQ